MGVGPAVAVPAALEAAGLSIGDVDVFEINEVRGANRGSGAGGAHWGERGRARRPQPRPRSPAFALRRSRHRRPTACASSVFLSLSSTLSVRPPASVTFLDTPPSTLLRPAPACRCHCPCCDQTPLPSRAISPPLRRRRRHCVGPSPWVHRRSDGRNAPARATPLPPAHRRRLHVYRDRHGGRSSLSGRGVSGAAIGRKGRERVRVYRTFSTYV
eukprot:scaffold29143_cov143-Isochrysis_galbana.AAC.3